MNRVCIYIIMIFSLASCAKWNETESVSLNPVHIWDRDPALWESYMEALRAYRQSEHYIFYARLNNSPEIAVSERSSMRSLPDSLDIVSLTNADNYSAADAEDLEVMHKKGIKVLWQLDFAGRIDEFSDKEKLEAYIDKAVAGVKEKGLDGWSFTSVRNYDDRNESLHNIIVSKLSEVKTKSQIIVCEGDPAQIAPADIEKIDYFVLATDVMKNTFDVHMCTIEATTLLYIPKEKILLSANMASTILDEDKVTHNAVTEMNRRVISYGPFAGLAIYDIEHDYYHPGANYLTVRAAIQILNPSR